jgi:hypothetical protein
VSIDRRTFILMTAPVVAAGSVLAIFPSGLPGMLSTDSMAAGRLELDVVAFKIYGWDQLDVLGAYASETSSISEAENLRGDRVFISINRSWQAAWR